MTTIGWVIFITANLAVIALTAYCFKKVFSLEQEHLHSTLEIDTKDINGGNGKGKH